METISAEILNTFKEIDEGYIDKLLNDEIEKNNATKSDQDNCIT